MVERDLSECYSRNGENFLLREFFSGRENGFYVDINAKDAVQNSNSYVFERFGWRGLCVVADPKAAALCRDKRPGAICVEAAIIGRNSEDNSGRLSKLRGLFKVRRPLEARTSVLTMTFDQLLEQHAPLGEGLDFVSIGAGGTEADILEAFSFKKRWCPKVFLINTESEAEQERVIRLLRPRGYQLARQIDRNLIFTRHPDDALLLRYKHVDCEVVDPLAKEQPAHQNSATQTRRHIKGSEGWFAENVLVQAADQPLHTLFDQFDPAWSCDVRSVGIVHAVNLFAASETQERTIQTMKRAAARSVSRSEGPRVTLLSVQTADELQGTPEGFSRSRDLDRSILDVKLLLCPPRRLPLLFDILDRAAERAAAEDFVIYSNSDICLAPEFYLAIQALAGAGFDAIVVNRRTIGPMDAFARFPNLRAAEVGTTHPGYDCFVFRRSLYDRFVKTQSCIGMVRVDLGLLYNLVAHADRMIILRNVNLTYHYGHDREWQNSKYSLYRDHTISEIIQLVAALMQDSKAARRLTDFLSHHPARDEVKALLIR